MGYTGEMVSRPHTQVVWWGGCWLGVTPEPGGRPGYVEVLLVNHIEMWREDHEGSSGLSTGENPGSTEYWFPPRKRRCWCRKGP